MNDQCEYDGCANPGEHWRFPIEENPDIYLCPDHAVEAGFCVGCGAFCPGSDGSDVHHQTGLCRDCYESDFPDDNPNDADGDLDFGWDYPHDWYDSDMPADEEDSTHTYIGPRDERENDV